MHEKEIREVFKKGLEYFKSDPYLGAIAKALEEVV